MRQAERRQQGISLEDVYVAHKVCLEEFTPVANRTFWARWLYLERALEVASLSGDLLFAAIVLRTMAEDTWALLRLVQFKDQLNAHLPRVLPQDLERIRRHGDLLLARFLPPIELLGIDAEQVSISPPRRFEGDGYGGLERIFQSLNDYVHPNYGSHLLALFPEDVKAVRILIEAYITVYEHFYKIPWLEDVMDSPGEEMPPLCVRSWQEEGSFLLQHILPEIQQHLAERGLAPRDADPASSFRSYLQLLSDTNTYPALAWEVEPGWFIPLRPLGEFVAEKGRSDQELYNALTSCLDLGVPTRLFEATCLGVARALANELQSIVSEERPSAQEKTVRWLRFEV
jgi:hypothetical protein